MNPTETGKKDIQKLCCDVFQQLLTIFNLQWLKLIRLAYFSRPIPPAVEAKLINFDLNGRKNPLISVWSLNIAMNCNIFAKISENSLEIDEIFTISLSLFSTLDTVSAWHLYPPSLFRSSFVCALMVFMDFCKADGFHLIQLFYFAR